MGQPPSIRYLVLSWLRRLSTRLNQTFSQTLALLLPQFLGSRASAALNTKALPRYEAIRNRMPPGSWDSHMHIMDGVRYPNYSRKHYTLKERYTLEAALSFESTIGIKNIVVVQPSCYGMDNSCVLDALRDLGPSQGRGVVAFDPDQIEKPTLQEWHRLGVRGVRINLQSVGKRLEKQEMEQTLRRYAEVIKPMGWVMQLYVPLAMIAELEDIILTLEVRVCFDHFGSPTLPIQQHSSGDKAPVLQDPYTLAGFSSLVRLLQEADVFTKFSAPYRISGQAPLYSDLDPVSQELLRVAGGNKLVYASDWPHTRFDGMDIRPWTEKALDWCANTEGLTERLFRDNAKDLWDVK